MTELIILDGTKTPVVVSFSVDHPDAPEVPKGTVRGEIVSSLYRLVQN